MNGQNAIFNNVMQKAKSTGSDFADSILSVLYMLIVFIGLWIFKLAQGIYFLVLGGIVAYFLVGSIGLLLCFFFGTLCRLYLGH
jgi:integral membrane sensor domain MASE1